MAGLLDQQIGAALWATKHEHLLVLTTWDARMLDIHDLRSLALRESFGEPDISGRDTYHLHDELGAESSQILRKNVEERRPT